MNVMDFKADEAVKVFLSSIVPAVLGFIIFVAPKASDPESNMMVKGWWGELLWCVCLLGVIGFWTFLMFWPNPFEEVVALAAFIAAIRAWRYLR
jgi:hypothetical protein